MDTQVADSLRGTLVDGRYRVRGLLMHGAITNDYQATDERLDRPVVLKLVKPAREEAVRRLVEQARDLAALTHPNVVAVYDQGRYEGLPYLVTEFVRGRSLRDLLTERGRLTAAEALAVTEQVLAAVAAAHRAGHSHGDLRPEQIQVASPPSAGRGDLVDAVAKVADFGLARAVADGRIASSGYAPPTRPDGRPDPRADVYAVGMILAELLTGDRPVPADGWQPELPVPSRRAPGLPPSVDDLVAWAVRGDAGGRPVDARTLLTKVQTTRERLVDDVRPPSSGGPAVGSPATPTVVTPTVRRPPTDSTVLLSAVPAGDERPSWARLPDGRSAPRSRRAERPAPAPVPRPGTVTRARRSPMPGVTGLVSGRQRQALIAGTVAVVLVLLVGGWWLGVGRYTTAPELVGLTAAQATAQAERQGLTVDFTSPRHDLEVPAEHVLAQEPDGRIRKGGTLVLTLSLGPEALPVPDVVGVAYDLAARQLAGLGLVVEEGEEQYSDTVPEGRVLALEPPAGEEIAGGGTVKVTVSKGRSPLRAPLLIGKQEDAARAELQQLGLQAEVEHIDDDRPAGEVVSQEPSSDTGVEPDSTVKIQVSKGPPTRPVPNVVGSRCREAVSELEEAGFAVGFGARERGRVALQNPTGGTGLPPGSEVVIWCL